MGAGGNANRSGVQGKRTAFPGGKTLFERRKERDTVLGGKCGAGGGIRLNDGSEPDGVAGTSEFAVDPEVIPSKGAGANDGDIRLATVDAVSGRRGFAWILRCAQNDTLWQDWE